MQVTGVASGGMESDSPISRGNNMHITYECAYKRTGIETFLSQEKFIIINN